MKISKGTIIRTVILLIALINQFLTIAGKAVLPFSDEQITNFLSMALTGTASIIAWWKNNSFTQSAISADMDLKRMKQEEKQEIISTDSEVDVSLETGQNPNEVAGIE